MSADRTRAPVRSLAVALEGGQAGAVVSSVNGTSGARCSGPTPPSGVGSRRSGTTCIDRIAEAEREGWLGEIEGLKVSLAGTEDKLAQIDTSLQRQDQAVHIGMPAFPDIAGRSVPGPEGQQ